MDLFGTAGIRGDARTQVTPSFALAVGRALADVGEEFVVGRDGRETGTALAAAVEAGLISGGADVIRLGQIPTPALAFASRGRRGVMVTASHNPPRDNGLKMFVDGQEYDQATEATIESRVAEEQPPTTWEEWGETSRQTILDRYRDEITQYTRRMGYGDCNGLVIAVDCGSGVAASATPQVLDALGATVVAVNAHIDGYFHARPSKPTAENLADFSQFIADGVFDLGIAHDGDGDRIVILDTTGDIVHEDTVLAILAGYYVRQTPSSDPVVITTPNASGRIDDQVTAAGGRIERVRLGALHEGVTAVKSDTPDGTDVVFAAEPWKHIHPALGPWIDGVASASMFATLVAHKDLESLRSPIAEQPYRKVNIPCGDAQKSTAMEAVQRRLPEQFPAAQIDTTFGVRATFDDGTWTLVRPSGTEPYIRVYAESTDVDTLVDNVVVLVEEAVASAD